MDRMTTWGLRALGIAGLGAAAGLYKAARGIPTAMGGRPEGERARRVAASPHFHDGRFHNEEYHFEPSSRSLAGTAKEMLVGKQARHPGREVPLVGQARSEVEADGLHVTWFGHSSVLLEVDGVSVLVDPVWGDRVSPSAHIGPKRLHPNPIELDDLPRIDVVVISHDHYDHLDEPTVRWLDANTECHFVVPLGVGAHLAAWGVDERRIEDLDWDDDTKVGDVRIICTQAQHFSGRGFARDGTQWASWVLQGPEHRVFYSGDGGYFGGFSRIGERHGPFDLTLVQVGAYDGAWPTIHMTPEQGLQTHIDVRGRLLLPVHWCTFNLAFHAWAEPVERLLAAAQAQEVRVVVPRPGERISVGSPVAVEPWWR